MITEWAFHDLGHLKQILEIKRYALYPRMGNMRAFYKLIEYGSPGSPARGFARRGRKVRRRSGGGVHGSQQHCHCQPRLT